MKRRRNFSRGVQTAAGVSIRAALLILAMVAVLFVFAYFHHVRTTAETGAAIVVSRAGSVHAGTQTEDEGALSGIGMFEFEGKFKNTGARVENGIIIDDGEKCTINIYCFAAAGKKAYVADVYIKDISCFKTVMANDTYGKNQREDVSAMALRSGKALTVTGDNYSMLESPCVVRNGVVYSMDTKSPVCALFWNGEMEMVSVKDFSINALVDKGIYQAWSGGEILVETSLIEVDENAGYGAAKPRAAIGYFEPGHYCFMVTEADTTIYELAVSMQKLGVNSAYMLACGGISAMAYNGGILNARDDRDCADIISIGN